MARQYYRNPYSTRRPSERSPAPSLAGVWLLIGIFLGVGIMGLAYIFYSPVIPQQLKLGEHGTPGVISAETDLQASQPQRKTHSYAKTRRNSKSDNVVSSQNESGQRFEFYTLLPGMEVALPDQPSDRKGNASQNTQNKLQAKSEGRIDPKMTQKREAELSMAAAVKNSGNEPLTRQKTLQLQKYIVQAGLFQKLNEADALKARLTLQGFQPRMQRIETQQGKIWFRVTLGPFVSESQALQQKKRLEDQQIHGILILQRANETQT